MKKEKRNSKSTLEYFSSLYEAAASAYSDELSRFEKNRRQYLGDDLIDGSSEKALIVRNITYEMIESELDEQIPLPRADAVCYSEQRDLLARTIERLCTAVRKTLPFEEMNDRDERNTYIYGGSIWYVEWDERYRDEAAGGIRIRVLEPEDFIPQPGIPEIEDMEYCFLKFTTTKNELMVKYGVPIERLSLAEIEYEYGKDPLSDTVKLITAFYRGEDGNIGKFVFSGDLTLADLPAYYKRRQLSVGKSEEDGYTEADGERIRIGEETVSVPYYTPRRFPIVIRKNISSDSDSLLGASDCEAIRPQQQAINKLESRILQKLLRAGITPVMPEGTSVSLNNSVFGQIIRMRPGESLDSFGKIDTTPDVSQDIAEADRLYEQAKKILGISDAIQGFDGERSESGYAKELKIARASARLEPKKRMKYLAYSELYRLIFEHYLAFADGDRELRYKDASGRVHNEIFNRTRFVESGEGGYRYCDAYIFTLDENSGATHTKERLWQINLENLSSGTLGDINDPRTLLHYWQSQEMARYPFARENVEYFKDLIEKGSRNV